MSTGQTQKTSFQTNRRAARLNIGLRTLVSRTAPIAAAALLMTAPSAFRVAQAQTTDSYDSGSGAPALSKGPTIDLDVANASLLTVVQALKMQSKAQIVVVYSKRYQPVTLTVTTSLDDALHYVAQSAGAVVTRDANGVYTFQPASDGSSPLGMQTAAYAPGYGDSPAAATAPQEAMHTEMIQLQYVDPNYVMLMINDPTGYRPLDPANNPTNNPYIANAPYAQHVLSTNPNVSEMNPYTANNTGAQQPGVPLQGGSYAGTSNAANRAAVNLGDQAGQFIPGQFPGGLTNPNQVINPGGISSNPFQNLPNNNNGLVGSGLPGNGNGQGAGANLRPQGISSIIANEENNALIVRGTPEGIAELKQIIGFLDRAPRQVQIKVEFITTNVANVDQFGINWEFLPFSNVASGFNGGGTATGTVGTSYLTFAQGNIAAQLLATLSQSNSKVVAAPIITTTNNVEGLIDFSSEIPYTTTSTVAQGSGNAISNTTVNFLPLTNSLEITPRINGDDSISLALSPTLTAVSGASVNGAPPTTEQSVRTYRTVANGETMVIGGLVQKNITNAHDYIPFLSQLPIIGSLFRTRNLSVSDSELLIFVTPTILPPIGSGGQTLTEAGGAQASGDSSAPIGIGVSP